MKPPAPLIGNHDLGPFIRAHRERLRPEDVGIRSIGRRRTPGLRREELAQLCGISATWLTWLEQGRPVTASRETLSRLSEALRLTGAERQYLFTLAGKAAPTEQVGQTGEAAVLACVAHVDAPAYVLDREWNALAWNDAARELFIGWLDTPEAGTTNLLRFTFLSPQARTLISDWPDRARRLVAEFRADCGRHADPGPVQPLVAALCVESPEFALFWKDHDVIAREGGKRAFHHPARGLLEFEQTTFYPAVRGDLKLVMLLPVARGTLAGDPASSLLPSPSGDSA